MRYTHWLTTEGPSPGLLAGSRRLVPIVLVAKSQASLKDLRRIVEREALIRVMMFLPYGATALDKMKALVAPAATRLLTDLWVSEVRLSPDGADTGEGEEAIEWVLVFNPDGRMMPDWQGPADGVIPKATPVTIRSKSGGSFRFEIELQF